MVSGKRTKYLFPLKMLLLVLLFATLKIAFFSSMFALESRLRTACYPPVNWNIF